MKKIANHGGLKKNKHEILGRNSRLDNIQAGILRVKLKRLNKWIKLRNKQANLYHRHLSMINEISLIKRLSKTKSTFHLMVIRTRKRNSLKKFLKKEGIITAIHYPLALPETKVFKKHHRYCKKMNSLKFSKEIISLPIGEHLNLKHIENICNKIKIFFNG